MELDDIQYDCTFFTLFSSRQGEQDSVGEVYVVCVGFSVMGVNDVIKQSSGLKARSSVACKIRLWVLTKVLYSVWPQVTLCSLPISCITQRLNFSKRLIK